jgi:Fe-S cluster assembly iron-binding protein IscA
VEIYGVTLDDVKSDPKDLSHLPEELQDMILDPKAISYLADAYVKYATDTVTRQVDRILQESNAKLM